METWEHDQTWGDIYIRESLANGWMVNFTYRIGGQLDY
jgi:hypothetical protein